MIRFQQVCLMRGIKPLLENADLTLNPGDKIGLIGANGAGKSSLFALLRGELHADQGEIDFPAQMAHGLRGAGNARRSTAPRSNTRSTATSRCASCKPSWPRWKRSRTRTKRHRASASCTRALADADAYTVQLARRAAAARPGLLARRRCSSRSPASPAAGACA